MAVVDRFGNPVRSGSGAAVGSLYDSNNGNNNTTNTGRTTTTGSVVTPLDLANITGGNYPYNFLNIQDTGGNPNTQGNTYANAPSLFTQSDTGAYYPDSVPDTMFKGLGSGLTGGLTNLLLEKLGGKLGKDSYLGGLLDAYINFDPLGDFAEQTQFGMNKESMLEYKLQESSNPEWATMSETERVAMARSPQLTNQLTYAFIAGGQGNLTEAQLDSIRPEGFSDEQWDGLSKQMKSQLSQSGSGRGVFDNVRDSRQAKTDWLMADREGFITQLCKELVNFEKLCAKTGVVPYVRLNVISDVQWELKAYGAIPDRFPNINFFDYTKMAKRLTKLPRNYELMFSYSKAIAYEKQVAVALNTDAPMSVVGIGPMPDRYLGKDVVSGDISDIENLKHRNKVLWLTYKVAKGQDVKPEEEIFIVDTRGNTEAFVPTYQVL